MAARTAVVRTTRVIRMTAVGSSLRNFDGVPVVEGLREASDTMLVAYVRSTTRIGEVMCREPTDRCSSQDETQISSGSTTTVIPTAIASSRAPWARPDRVVRSRPRCGHRVRASSRASHRTTARATAIPSAQSASAWKCGI